MLLLALVHAQNGPTEVWVERGGREGGVRAEKQRYYHRALKGWLLRKTFHGKHFPRLTGVVFFVVCFFLLLFSLTCPEGGGLPVVVVVGEAGEARHAARVVVLEPLEELPQLLSALLLLLQPLRLLLWGNSGEMQKRGTGEARNRKQTLGPRRLTLAFT